MGAILGVESECVHAGLDFELAPYSVWFDRKPKGTTTDFTTQIQPVHREQLAQI